MKRYIQYRKQDTLKALYAIRASREICELIAKMFDEIFKQQI